MVIRGVGTHLLRGLRLTLALHLIQFSPTHGLNRFTITSSTRLTHSLRLPLLSVRLILTLQPLARRSLWVESCPTPVHSPASAPPAPRPCGPSCWPAPPPPRS